MPILEYIDLFWFLIAFAIGLFYTYITAPEPQIVIKYPTPFNAGRVTYIDKNDVCYKYQMQKVECPVDRTKIKRYDLQ
jgi:hypothetical protein